MWLKSFCILFFTSFVFYSQIFSQSVRINEFSQGTSGSKEWVELVVGSSSPVNTTNCVLAKVNIGGWILDDNNGDFSPINHFTGSGVATGHMRFRNVLPWNNLPIGAIIVIYNAADRDINIPPDDPYDWLNNDCVYIIPSNHTSIEYCTTSPSATNCTTRTDYTSCTYTSTGNWNNVSLANAGDAIQVRNPSFGLVHGLVYGRSTSASGCTTTPDMVGSGLAPIVSNVAMSLTAASFIGTTDADYFDATKWLIIPANTATPGSYNNLSNENYIINTLRGGCTCHRVLPGEYFNLKANQINGNFIALEWDENYPEYYVERSTDVIEWKFVNLTNETFFLDKKPQPINFFRIKNSKNIYSNIVKVIYTNVLIKTKYYDILGREINDMRLYPKNSIYFEVNNGQVKKKINIQ